MNDIVQRWRLVLGTGAQETTGCVLGGREQRMDKALAALYGESDKRERRGGLSTSAPKVSTWLGDIREFFPQLVVQVMQQDAVERLNLSSLLTEKKMLANVVPDVHLVATLMSLSRVIPEKNKALAREVVRRVVEELFALNDDGAPFYDKSHAVFRTALVCPSLPVHPTASPT